MIVALASTITLICCTVFVIISATRILLMLHALHSERLHAAPLTLCVKRCAKVVCGCRSFCLSVGVFVFI